MSLPDKNSITYSPLPLGDAKPARKLRVCVASFDFVGPVKNGGVGTAFTSLAEAMARAGHDVTCLFLAGNWCENRTLDYWIADYHKRGIKFVPLPETGLRYETAWHIARGYEGYLWLKNENFDIVHFSEWKGPGYFSLQAKKHGLALDNTVLCVHTHGPTLWHKLSNGEYVTQVDDVQMDYLERRSVQMAEVLVSPSQYLLRWMTERGWTLPEQTFVQPYVRPATARAPRADAGTLNSTKELVFFGRLEVRKGLVLFCDALDLVKNDADLRNVSITFLGKVDKIGNISSAEYLAARARNWPWKWQIISDRDQAGAMDYLQEPDRVAVLPSLVDNLPNTVLECLGANIPFITSDAGGIPEMIAGSDLDAVCFPLRAEAFADKIRTVVRHGLRPATPSWDPRENESAWVHWHETALGTDTGSLSLDSLNLGAEQPLVSVCISHWNRPEYLKQALASIEAMDYPNYEVVLVDDGSTQPEALGLIAKLEKEFAEKNWQLLRHPENRYPGAARNTAARAARGEYLMFMDDDNCAKPHELSTFVKVAQRTGAEILTCCLDTFSGAAAPHANLKPRSRWLFLGDDAATGAFRNCFGDTNSLIRRDVFHKIGGFHEDWGVGHEDWEFFAKAVLLGCKLEVVPEALAWYRLNVNEQSVNRKTPLHRNHMVNIRPYTEIVPPALRNLIYLAQGQDVLLAGPAAQGRIDPAEQKFMISWNAKIEAAKMFAKKQRKADAIELLLDAVKIVEQSKRPVLVFETLLAVSKEMYLLDKKRAESLVHLAVQLAEALKNQTMIQVAKKSLASLSTTPVTVAKAQPFATLPDPAPTPSMTNSARVSIVIPVYNQLELTRSCLESIVKFPPATPCDITVVNNASTDGTGEFLRELESLGGIRVIHNGKNEGFARGCNCGAQTSPGSLLLFLNNDTQVTAGWLDTLVQAASKPGVGVVGAKLLYANGRVQHAGIGFINGLPDHPHRNALADALEVNRFRELDMVTGACLMIHRDLFLQLGGFDEVYRNGVEDVDLCLRARAAGRKVVYEPRAVVYHLEGQSEGRFSHVSENLKLFFGRWGKSFDRNFKFKIPQPAKAIRSAQSVLIPRKDTSSSKTETVNLRALTVSWEGSFLDFGSLSHVNRELTGALEKIPGTHLNRVNTARESAKNGLRDYSSKLSPAAPEDVQVSVRHAWPPDWKRPRQGKLVVIQPWEFGSLPCDWVSNASDVDEFWVPTEAVRKFYTESGIDAAKVQIVPNGIQADLFKPEAAPRPLPTKKKFRFLFVGGTIGRKGPDVLLNAYLKNFTAADDVCLVIKDFGNQSVYRGQTFAEQIKKAQSLPNAPEILYFDDELKPEELPGLYTACDCLVHPYRGEGFGLPVLEAMACALPVVVTGGGATDDFATDEFAYRLSSTRRPLGHEVGGMKLVAEGWLLEPSIDDLATRMKWMVTHVAEARVKGLAASKHARMNWTWENAAKIAATRLAKLQLKVPANQAPATAPVNPATQPECATLGNVIKAREAFGRKDFNAAWNNAIAAVESRPFHPEAYLLLAEIALAANDGNSARKLAQYARDLAPGWKAAKQFLQKPLKGNATPDWLVLPDSINNRQSSIGTRLSVCVITKNEERFIEQCLNSIKPIAHQIVVVDTGSTDRTVEIAKALGAEVHAFTWCDDFSAARNAALEHATGDWILMLDADEELPADQHENLLKDIRKNSAIAYRLPLVNEGQNDGRSFVPRLFRNAPGVHFFGRIHEQVFPSLIPFCKPWGLETLLGTAQLLHHGYTKELVKDRNKIERNLRLLQQAVVERPNDPNLTMNFGLELVRSGELHQGLEKYREAFQLMSAQSPADVVPELREVLLTQITVHLYKDRQHDEIVRVLNSPLAKNGGLTASLHFALGLALFELKQPREAAEQMRQCVAKRNQPALSPINTDILTAAPNHCLALSLAQIGEVAGAKQAFEIALTESGKLENVKFDYAKLLASQDEPVEALHKLHEVVAENPAHFNAWKLGAEIALKQREFLEFACDWTSEAIRALPNDPAIIAFRAEALLLSQQTEHARPLWEKACNCVRPPNALAALILCSAVEAQPIPETRNPDEELAASKAFVGWYQRLVNAGAQETVIRLNSRVDALRTSLPTAARLLDSALAEAK